MLTSADAGREYFDRLRKAGVDAVLTTFPGARHGSDNGASAQLVRIPGVPTAARCQSEEFERGRIVNADTGRPLDDADACIGTGLVAGYDAAADAATRAAVASRQIRSSLARRW